MRKALSNGMPSTLVLVICFVLTMLIPDNARSEEQSIKLAVMDIHDKTSSIEQNTLESLTDFIRTVLSESKQFIIIDKTRQAEAINMIVQEQRKESYKPCYDEKCQIPLGKSLSADSILRSYLSKIGSNIIFNVEMISLEKKAVISGAQSRTQMLPREGLEDRLMLVIEETLKKLIGAAPVPLYQSNNQGTQNKNNYKNKNLPKWPFKLSDEQVAEIETNGCDFSPRALAAAGRMQKKGFTVEQYLEAYRNAHMIQTGNENNSVEILAAFSYLGIPYGELSAYNVSGYNITQYYNSKITGKGSIITGWIFFGVGMLFLAGTIAIVAQGGPDIAILGGIYGGTAAVHLIIGLPLAISGHVKWKKRAPEDLLDTGTLEEIEKYRKKSISSIHSLSPIDYKNGERTRENDGKEIYLSFSPLINRERSLYGIGMSLQY